MVNAIKQVISELEEEIATSTKEMEKNDINILRLETSNAILRQHIETINDRISKLEDRLLELER